MVSVDLAGHSTRRRGGDNAAFASDTDLRLIPAGRDDTVQGDMPIEIPCDNPACGKVLSVADDCVGVQIQCPLCHTAVTVPQPVAAPEGAFEAGFGEAFRYAFSSWSGLIKPAVVFSLLTATVGLVVLVVLDGFLGGDLDWMPSLWAAVICDYLLVAILLGGYFLRCGLHNALATLEGMDQPGDAPPIGADELIATGVKDLAMVAVYILPIVTLGLLPMALLALAQTDDARAFDVARIARATARRKAAMARVWLVVAPVLLAATALLVGMSWLTAKAIIFLGDFGWMGLLPVLLVLAPAVSIACILLPARVVFRVVGLLGRHDPQLLEELSEPSSPHVWGGSLATGLALSALVVLAARAVVRPRWPKPPDHTARGPAKVIGGYYSNLFKAKGRAEALQPTASLHSLHQALIIYSTSHGGRYPGSLDDLVRAGLIGRAALHPSRKDRRLTFGYVPGLNSLSPGRSIVVYEPGPNFQGKRQVLCVNGQIASLAEADFQKRLAAQRPATPTTTRPGSERRR